MTIRQKIVLVLLVSGFFLLTFAGRKTGGTVEDI